MITKWFKEEKFDNSAKYIGKGINSIKTPDAAFFVYRLLTFELSNIN